MNTLALDFPQPDANGHPLSSSQDSAANCRNTPPRAAARFGDRRTLDQLRADTDAEFQSLMGKFDSLDAQIAAINATLRGAP